LRFSKERRATSGGFRYSEPTIDGEKLRLVRLHEGGRFAAIGRGLELITPLPTALPLRASDGGQ
jgi:hypothetical protein